jgi:hypothetical protein
MVVGRMPTAQQSVWTRGTGILPVFVRQMIFPDNFQSNFEQFPGTFVKKTFCRRHTGETPVPRFFVL